MKIETATKAKTHFDQVLEKALVEPVIIEKSGRQVAVLLAYSEYQRLASLADGYWLKKAKEVESEGFVGAQASEELLSEVLNVKD